MAASARATATAPAPATAPALAIATPSAPATATAPASTLAPATTTAPASTLAPVTATATAPALATAPASTLAPATAPAPLTAPAPALDPPTASAPAPPTAPAPALAITTAPAPALAPTPLYFTMVVTQMLSTYNDLLQRYNEYLIWIVANMSSHEPGPLLTRAPGSEATEIVEHEVPLGLPQGGRGQFIVRLFVQPKGRNGLTRRPMRREYFVYELFQDENNLGDPVTTRTFTPPTGF